MILKPNPTFFPIARATNTSTQRWATANKHVLWGWKRDVRDLSRVVFFSGDLSITDEWIGLSRGFFFLKGRVPHGDIEYFNSIATHLSPIASSAFGTFNFSTYRVNSNMSGFIFSFGTPTPSDIDKVARLQRRLPRRHITSGDFPDPTIDFRSGIIFPTDIYIGSGLSYECGLPTLCDMHNRFCLDDYENHSFTVGKNDKLPEWLLNRFEDTIKSFCDVHIGALNNSISDSYRKIHHLFKKKYITKIYTDNVDNMFSLLDVPYERTRGSGVFNERHPATPNSNRLLVIGVAADRRELIKQYRRFRNPLTIVNPCLNVSPGVQHLNYVRRSDTFFRMTAHEFFKNID